MRLSNSSIATATAAAALGAAAIWRNRQSKQAAERMAAAALESLLRAIDANDPDTGVHVRRVAEYALLLADAAGLSKQEQRSVTRVALFHDIGKIHEALFDIIHDVKRLTPAERRAVMTHPRRGADVLQPLAGFYPELQQSVLAHHERWDGSGYPRGLKGRQIPIAARVVAIADTFDAITHRRQYSDGRSVEEARRILLEGRGVLFDPWLIDVFLMPPVWADVLAAYRRVSRWSEPVALRRPGRRETQVPDIIFRWRPPRRAGRARHSAGHRPRATR
ncbi:MAG TPA: HD domain-containing phosphohydrolase [Gemmatimonadaceae bacterium]|jgi:putative two-component system response regulator